MASTVNETASRLTGRTRARGKQLAGRLREHVPKGREVNVGLAERVGSGVVGATLAMLGVVALLRRSSIFGGLTLAAAGAGLAYRSATGHCSMYSALGVTEEDAAPGSHPLNRFIHASRRVTINRSPTDLYNYWRNFENLPSIMRHLERVEAKEGSGDGWSHWVAKAPRGRVVEWDARIIEDRPGELIAWRSAEDAEVPNHGHVRFEALPHGHGTALEVSLSYQPPAGVVGAAVARVFGESPQQQLREDLRRFKQVMEAGEIATTAGQPRGTCR